MHQNKKVQQSIKKKKKTKKVPKHCRFLYTTMLILLFLNESQASPIEVKGEKSTYQYNKGNEIGRGGYSTVYKGIDTETGALVALKEIKITPDNSNILKNYRAEIQIMQKLNHKNIIKLIDQAETSDALYIITEICNGDTLLDKVLDLPVKVKKFDEKTALKIFQELWDGVKYLHSEQNIVHRDLKLDNIMLCNTPDDSTVLKIIDFGFAYDDEKQKYRNGGTPEYMAPEAFNRSFIKCQEKDHEEIEMIKKEDVWSMGVILHICVSGYFPLIFDKKDTDKVIYKKMINYTAKFSDKNWKKVSENTQKLVGVMLSTIPEHRLDLDRIKYATEHPEILIKY